MTYFNQCNVSVRSLPPISRRRRAKDLFELLSSVSDDDLDRFVRQFKCFNLPESNMDELMRYIESLVPDDGSIRLTDSEINDLRNRVLIEVCHPKRKTQLKILQQQEWRFNVVSNNSEPIRVQNNVDFATIPDFFVYVDECVLDPNVRFKNPAFEVGCGLDTPRDGRHECDTNCACFISHNAKPPYNRDGQLVVSKNSVIFECNKACRCDRRCKYRVVQNGCQFPVMITRCSRGAGWCVKTLKTIAKGTFVGTYSGKLIPWQDADNLPTFGDRGKYVFDVRNFKDDEVSGKYCVDAFKYGSFTRFMNHSCEPNLSVKHCWTQYVADYETYHDIAFFADREIYEGEELTFNYGKKELFFDECKCVKCTEC